MNAKACLFFLCVSGFVVLACKDKGDSGSTGPKSEYVYECKIGISKKMAASDFSANESDTDEKVAAEKAWKAVCAKLSAEEQPKCRDEKRWRPSVSTMKMSSNVETKFGVTVSLAPIVPQVHGNATSETSEAAACAEAVKKACAAAGATADCVVTGAFERKGESKGRTLKALLGGR
ncbi:MAG: hypothetical protein HYY84_03490 [Deltaproteobacteria bacterium]|nr:hypothetical protein [Deltaproteobacteria bacterium]